LKPKLLIIELWGLGDLVIATPFLRAAAGQFDVTLLAKPYALDLQPRLWPGVKVFPFNAPWTAFKRKYHFWRWPFLEMIHLRRRLAAEHFQFGISARWDPREHLLLKILAARERIGFPRIGSSIFLTQPLTRPDPASHRYESWRVAGRALGLELPSRHQLPVPPQNHEKTVLLHSGARLPARIWPLENWRKLALHLRQRNYTVHVVCDADQENWWKQNGESGVANPRTVTALLSIIDRAGILVGNCSGPGHLAAISGVPTFTIYGPSLSEWFEPLHPFADGIEGKACPYKPCSDYCHFAKPFCIQDIPEEVVLSRVEQFVRKHLPVNGTSASARSLSGLVS